MKLLFSPRLLLATTVACCCAASSGLAFGYSSAAAFQIFLNVIWSAVFASCLNVGGLIGSLLSGYFLSKYGRRWTMLSGCLPGIVGWIWLRMSCNGVYERYAPTPLFICGRILTGVSAGMTIPASALYLAEIAPPEWYSIFGTLTQLGIVCGIALAYLFGALFPWENAALIDAVIMIVILVGILFLPESPRWLLKSGQIPLATSAHTWLHGSPALSLNVESIKTNYDDCGPDAGEMREFLDYVIPCRPIPKELQSRLRLTMFIMVLQQLTGINAILYFAESICLFGGLSWASTCALSLGIFQIVFTLMAGPIVNRVSRKRVLMWTAAIMCFAHLVHGFVLLILEYGTPHLMWNIVAIACVVVFLFGFSVGWGPVPILLTMDLFPTATRGFAVSSVIAVNWVASLFITALFEPLSLFVGSSGVFWLFSVFCALTFVFTRRYVPESTRADVH